MISSHLLEVCTSPVSYRLQTKSENQSSSAPSAFPSHLESPSQVVTSHVLPGNGESQNWSDTQFMVSVWSYGFNWFWASIDRSGIKWCNSDSACGKKAIIARHLLQSVQKSTLNIKKESIHAREQFYPQAIRLVNDPHPVNLSFTLFRT